MHATPEGLDGVAHSYLGWMRTLEQKREEAQQVPEEEWSHSMSSLSTTTLLMLDMHEAAQIELVENEVPPPARPSSVALFRSPTSLRRPSRRHPPLTVTAGSLAPPAPTRR